MNPTMMNPSAVAGAARYIEREYGESGYSMGCVYSGASIHFFLVRCFDGSEFYVVSDRWENARTVEDDERIPLVREEGTREVPVISESGLTYLGVSR